MACRRSTCCTAYVASIAAFFVFAIPAARRQHRHSPILKDPDLAVRVDVSRLIIVVLVLAAAIGANVYANNLPEGRTRRVSRTSARRSIGVLLLLTPWRRPDWSIVPEAAQGQPCSCCRWCCRPR